jgi:hypothetical protein
VIATSIMLCVACGDSPTSPTSTTTPTTENFELTVPPQQDRFYSFNLSQAGDVKVGLMSVTLVPSPAASSAVLRVGIGVPAAEGCAVTNTVDVASGLTPQLTVNVTTGIHCIDVADPGTLPSAALVSIRYSHP